MPTYEVDVQGSTYEVDAPDPNTAWRWANITYRKSLEQTANKEVSVGQSSKDLAGSLVSGVGGLAQLPGQLYGLATGNFGGTEFGKNISDYGEGLKSEQLKAEEKLRNLKIQEAERKGGQLSAAGTAIKETFTHPRLLANFLVEQVPQLIPAMLTGGGTAALTAAGLTAKEAATLVASGVAKEAAMIAAKETAVPIAGRLGAAAAKGTGAIQQGADAGAQVYEDAYKKLKQNNVSDEEAAQRALSLARGAGASAAVISVLAQNLPGAGAIENLAAGVPGKFKGRLANLAAGAAGEAVGEAAEEGGGKFSQNLAMREVDPNQKLLAGVGEAAGMGAAGGIGLGGAAGVLRKPSQPETPPAGTQQQTTPAGTQPPPPPASSEQKAQERAQLVEAYTRRLMDTGATREEAQERAEEQVAKEEANDAQYEAEQQTAQQEAPSDVQQPNAEPTGASVPMASEPSAGAPTPGVGGPESTGVVSTAAPSGQPNAGESQQRAPLTSQQTTEGNINGTEATQTQQTETQKQKAPTPATNQPITSFTTSQGSTYQVDADGKTSRTKNSKGAGQGETYAPHSALYVSPEAQQRVLDDKNADGSNRSIRLGYHADGMFHPITDLTQIPQGAIPAVAVQDKTNNKVVGIYEASTKPQVGLHPIEKLYTEDGNSSTHVGNQIVDVRQGNVETPQAELTDEEKQNLQAELDEEQNKPAAKPAISSLTEDQKRTVQAELDAEYNDAVVKKSIAASIGKPDLAFHGFKTAVEAVQHVAKAGNALQKLFANRLAFALEGVKFVVVEGENLPPELGIPANEWNGANGAFVRDEKGNAYIVVRGLDSSRNFLYQGVNNITVLHEALHAALQQKIAAGLKGIDAGLTKAIRSLEKTMDLARERAQAQLDEDKLPLFLHDLLLDGKVFDDVHEFVSYAMTDPKFQKWLMDTPGHIVKTLYNQFVNNVRQFFNMSANSVNALSDIINITDQLLSEKPPSKIETERVQFSKAPKVTKASATEEKLGKGNFADDLRELSTLTKLRDQSEFVDNAMEFFGSLKEGAIRQLLVSLQTSAVVEWARRLGMDHIVDADKHMRDMAGEKNKRMNQMLPKFNKLVELRKKSLEQYKRLANIMHYTTLLSRDPTDAKVLAGDKVLQRLWNGLDENTKKLYEEIRDHYIEQHTAYYNVLTQQIEESKLEEPEKSKIIAAIKQVYETGRTMYPYFPLMRYGQYWVRVGKGVGREFHMFENKQDRNKFMKERAKQMGKTWKLAVSDGDMDVGDDLKSARINEEASATGQLKTLFAAINNGAIPVTDDFGNVVSDKSVVDAETLKSQIYQMFLQTLPDRNFRKQFIMRKGIAGFSGDIARNFVTNGINMANQLTRIEYGGKAMKELELAKDALQGDPDKLKKGEFLAEMAERITMQVRPDADDTVLHKVANLANTASYLWLMTSIKTAAAQLSSVPIFVGPVLTANHGFNPAKVAAALTKSLAVFGTNVKIKKNPDGTTAFEFPTMSMAGAAELTPDEKLAAEYMVERGITQNTNNYELVGRRNTSTAEAESSASKVKNAVVGVMTALFHHTERMIREITFMTSYRLYREDLGQSPDAHQRALELAEKETNEALGAYSAYERPRGVLQTAQRKVVLNAHGPLGKSLLQFKMFATFATTFFVRNAYRMFAGLDAKDRAQAMTKVMGSLLMSLSLAGYVGVPGISMAIGAVQGMMNGLKALGGDDDDEEELLEDRDWEFWFRNKWLPETFGETAGRILNRGLIAETTGYDITSSLSFQNMWFPEVREQATARATMLDYLVTLMGPSASLAMTIPKAIDYYNKGEIMRGMETLMPAFVRGAFTAERYEREGATTASNFSIKEAKEFTAGQIFMQGLGFASTDLVNQREFIYKAEGQILKVQRERAQLLDRLGRAETGEDEKDTEKIMEDIDKYNAKNSFLPIDDQTINQSLAKRQKAKEQAQRGMPYNKHFEGQFDETLERSLRGFEK
jgi:hypothetical protein